ncbi:MAG: GNAT family N-acetyltransferase [Candidatus Binatus sp.]|uniref:GNAT family N-acetyltransferase n=1 Tax=Candidatus Binatus sp. TaxID=2811406 RepID=UPI0027172392|nr:GNAT family N-acetyltransferase [Candidatus Binatus sp.]MDO8434232.1 GNAT family N-acetyltransferase [Candidatus Binatus sp.]
MPDDRKPIVTVLYPEQYEQAAVALGRAFIDDPTFKPILPDINEPVARAEHLADLFRVMLAIERRHGQPTFGVIEGGRVMGAAVTEGIAHPTTVGFMLAGIPEMPRLVRAIGWSGIVRAMQMFGVLAENHPKEPHLYLQLLGVDPAYQGKRFGGALLDRLKLEAAMRPDIAGVYLETATEANVAYYSGKGYEVLSEIFPLGVRMWRMFQRKR